MYSKNQIDIDNSIEFYETAKSKGYEFYFTRLRTYSYIFVYNPSHHNNKPYDPTNLENYLLTQHLIRKADNSKFKILEHLDSFEKFWEKSKINFIYFTSYGSGKIFADIYNNAREERKPHLLKNIIFYIDNKLDYNDLASLFTEINNLTIKEAKKIWDSISKIDFKIKDDSTKHIYGINDFLQKIYSNFDFDFSHEFVKHIAKNRSAQINSTNIYSTNFRNFLVEYYNKNNKEHLLEDFSKYLNAIKLFEKSKNEDYVYTYEPKILKQTINYATLSNSLRIDSWNLDRYVFIHRFLPILLQDNPHVEKVELLINKNNDAFKDSSLFVTLSEHSRLDNNKLNAITKNYFEQIKNNHLYINQIFQSNKDYSARLKTIEPLFSKAFLDAMLENKENKRINTYKL